MLKWIKSQQFKDLLQQWENPNVVWFVASPKNRLDIANNIDKYKQQLPHISIIHLKSWSELKKQNILADNLKAIVMYPSVHQMGRKDFYFLQKMSNNVPILHINGNDEPFIQHGVVLKNHLIKGHGGFSGLGVNL